MPTTSFFPRKFSLFKRDNWVTCLFSGISVRYLRLRMVVTSIQLSCLVSVSLLFTMFESHIGMIKEVKLTVVFFLSFFFFVLSGHSVAHFLST